MEFVGKEVRVRQFRVAGSISTLSGWFEVTADKLADALWQAGISDATPVNDKQKKLLDARWADYRAGRSKRISIAELEQRLAKP